MWSSLTLLCHKLGAYTMRKLYIYMLLGTILSLSVMGITSLAQSTLQVTFIPGVVETNPLNNQLIMSSVSDGIIYQADEEGVATPLIQDDALTNVVSMTVDPIQNRLYVINVDLASFLESLPGGGNLPNAGEGNLPFGGGLLGGGFPPAAGGQGPGSITPPEGFAPPAELLAQLQIPTQLMIFDLASQQRLLTVDLTAIPNVAGSFVNGVAVGPDGTAYVADSLAGGIYSVDLAGNITVLSSEGLSTEGLGRFLISYHPEGYLIVANASAGTLHKFDITTSTLSDVTLSPAPANLTNISTDEMGNIYASSFTEVWLFESQDAWVSAMGSSVVSSDQPILGMFLSEGTLHVLHPTELPELTPEILNSGVEINIQAIPLN